MEGAPGPPSANPAASTGLFALRLGIGLVWAMNCVYIFDPANDFFSGFSAEAASFAPVALGGGALPRFAAAHPAVFSILIAATTLYLAVAFLLGGTTRWACGIGIGFALALLVSQFGLTFVVPGGTDVGPMPIYVAVYAALLLGRAERVFSLDAWWGAHRQSARGGPALARTALEQSRGAERPRPGLFRPKRAAGRRSEP